MKIALNWLLFATESLGALIILWLGVPIYRRLLMGVTDEQAGAKVFFWASIGVTVIQASYWIRLRCFPPPRFSRQLILGHAIQFLGRLSFVFIGGMFGVVFFTRFQQLEFSVWKVSVLLAVLFSMFCYALDLDRLCKAFSEAQTEPAHGALRS
jgi:hypothetical protein